MTIQEKTTICRESFAIINLPLHGKGHVENNGTSLDMVDVYSW
jgi:hypothetical protein